MSRHHLFGDDGCCMHAGPRSETGHDLGGDDERSVGNRPAAAFGITELIAPQVAIVMPSLVGEP
jgi:hypothetical protein